LGHRLGETLPCDPIAVMTPRPHAGQLCYSAALETKDRSLKPIEIARCRAVYQKVRCYARSVSSNTRVAVIQGLVAADVSVT
jgi:hypothetical protein